MAQCLAFVSDMIFASKISGTAASVGVSCAVVRTPDGLESEIGAQAPNTVLLDLSCDGLIPGDVIRMLKARCPETRVVAFGSHVQTDVLDDARRAGADEVLPRSAFVQRLPDLLSA